MKFKNLFAKELRELITRQALVGMIFTMVLLMIMGQLFGQAMTSADTASGNAYVINNDRTAFTESVLKNAGKEINLTIAPSGETPETALSENDGVIVIPEGFSKTILEDKKPGELEFYGNVKFGGLSSSMGSIAGSSAVNNIFAASKDEVLLRAYGLTESDLDLINNVTETVEYSVFRGKTAKVSASALSAILMMQMLIAPVVILILMMMASQMIMVAISTEKIDKTLETLLSTPVSRLNVLLAKMAAALVSALLNAVFTAVGMVFYLSGFTGALITDTDAVGTMLDGESVNTALSVVEGLNVLGLNLTPLDFFLFFIQLFLSIAIGLSISLILGAMATDAKSLSNLLMPMMIVIMVPFVITLVADLNTMPLPFRAVMYLIPFTHTYTAIPNLIGRNYALFFGGMAYQILFFALSMFFAVRLFTSDKLFTASYAGPKHVWKKNPEEK